MDWGGQVIDNAVTLAEPDSYFEMLERSATEHWWSNGVEWIERRWIQNELKRQLRNSSMKWNWLDVGCGTGLRMSQWADWQCWDNRVGLEPEPSAMKCVIGDDKPMIVRCELPGLPFKTVFFDLVTGFDVIQHIPKPFRERALKELFQVVRPGGVLLFRTNAPGVWGDTDCDESIVSSIELNGFLIRNGFKIIRRSHYNMVGGLAEEVLVRYKNCVRMQNKGEMAFKTGLPKQWQIRPKGHLLARLVGWMESRIAGTGLVKIPFGHSYLVMARKEVDHE